MAASSTETCAVGGYRPLTCAPTARAVRTPARHRNRLRRQAKTSATYAPRQRLAWPACVIPAAYALLMATSLREWLAEHHPPDSAFRQSLAGVAERVRAGEDLRFAVREFLDEFGLLPRDDLRRAAIERRPLPTGDARADAYLGALAATAGVERPSWSIEPE